MTRLTLAAAAMVAGMTAFAANAQEAPELFSAAGGKIETKAVERSIAANVRTGRGSVAAAVLGSETPAIPVEAAAERQGKPGKGGMVPIAKVRADKKKTSTGKRQRPVLIAVARGETRVRGEAAEAVSGARAVGGGNYGEIISRYAATYGVPVALAHAVIRVESNFRANARGQAGEIGLMQIKPATARSMGYSGGAAGLYNPETNIRFGMKYLGMAHKLGGGATCATILKYNAGHGASRMNPVSAAYCRKVKRHLG